jgi:hypothetical protein
MVLYYLILDFQNKVSLSADLILHASHLAFKIEILANLINHNLRTAH